MKKLKNLLFITIITTFILSLATGAFAQDNHQIFINAKGGIYNSKGTQLGFIDKADIVRNNQGKKLYFIDHSGNVIDANGKNLGKARKNGDYLNIQGQSVLSVKDQDQGKCAILDPQGHNLGTVHKNYKLHACAAHCFFLEQQKKKADALKTK